MTVPSHRSVEQGGASVTSLSPLLSADRLESRLKPDCPDPGLAPRCGGGAGGCAWSPANARVLGEAERKSVRMGTLCPASHLLGRWEDLGTGGDLTVTFMLGTYYLSASVYNLPGGADILPPGTPHPLAPGLCRMALRVSPFCNHP